MGDERADRLGRLQGVGANPKWTPMPGQANKVPVGTWHVKDRTNALVLLFVKGAGSERFITAADQKDSMLGACLDNAEVGTIVKAMMNGTPVTGSARITDPRPRSVGPGSDAKQLALGAAIVAVVGPGLVLWHRFPAGPAWLR